MAPPGEKPVFADTSLGTHLVVAVPADITVGDLKRKLGREHSTCFPNLGEIKVHALMVKRKLQHYCLPDSMPIWNAFNGSSITWFLFLDVSLVEGIESLAVTLPHSICSKEQLRTRPSFGERSQRVIENVSLEDAYDQTSEIVGMKSLSEASQVLDSIACLDYWEEKKASDRTLNRGILVSEYADDCRRHTNPSWFPESPSGSLPGKFSVTGIISSYFPDCDEVDSYGFNSTEYQRVNNTKEFGESCIKIGSASNEVDSLDIGGSSLEQVGNCIEDTKKMKITKSRMAVSNARAMCLANGRTDASISKPVNNGRSTCKDDRDKFLENDAINCLKVAGHVSHYSLTDLTPRTPSSFDLHVKTSRKLGKTEVGKCLLIAACKFGLSSGKKRSSISKFIAQRGNASVAISTSPVRTNMFDISDGDD